MIELLVAAGILVVLASLLLPSVGRAREGARQMTCANNLRQLGTAFTSYVRENDARFPTCAPREPFQQLSSDWIFWEASGPRQRELNRSAIAPYLGRPLDKALLRCPSDDVESHAKYFDPPYRFSYVLNVLIATGPWSRDLPAGRIRNPSEKILLIEEDEHGIGDGSWWPYGGTVDWLSIRHDFHRLPETFSTNTNPLVGQGVVNKENPGNIDRRGNVVFCDGHCEFTTRRVVEDPMHYDPLK